MSFYVGIDPGMGGYLAALTDGGDVRLEPIPTLPTGRGGKRRYDDRAIFIAVRDMARGAELVLLECQQAMPGQGVSSCFSTGFGYGLLRMALVACRAPFEEVRPQVWKRRMGLSVGGKGIPTNERRKLAKALAVQKAQQVYPDVDLLPTARSRVPSPDMAEALLLARYARHRATGVAL